MPASKIHIRIDFVDLLRSISTFRQIIIDDIRMQTVLNHPAHFGRVGDFHCLNQPCKTRRGSRQDFRMLVVGVQALAVGVLAYLESPKTLTVC